MPPVEIRPNGSLVNPWTIRLGLWIALAAGGALVFAAPIDADDRPSLTAEVNVLKKRADELRQAHEEFPDLWADANIFLKGADWALDLEPQLDEPKTAMIRQAVRRATERFDALAAARAKSTRPAWAESRGRLIRGFISQVDGSTQPYGLVIPAHYDPNSPIRLDVVLHGSHGGRASGLGDLQFIGPYDAGDSGTAAPDVNRIEVFPMGRLGENAYRFEGETDVFEAIEAVCRNYSIDRTRIVLRGSSLGGVGSWQIGLKRPDRFVALGPTAGPVDTIEFANSPWPHFVRLDPLTSWQQRLLHLVDAIDYTANAGMVPVVAAMGDQDHYFSSHLLIEKEFAKEGIPFVGLVDVGGGHGVRAPVIAEQLRLIDRHADHGLDLHPRQIRFVTWTLKFSRCHWIEILRLDAHYERAEIHARVNDDGSIVVPRTQNISRFSLIPELLPENANLKAVTIGSTVVNLPPRTGEAREPDVFERTPDGWRHCGRGTKSLSGKRPGLQGPIDDAFATRFLCVRGTGTPWNPQVGAWSDANLKRFQDEWKRHYRGDLPIKTDVDVTPDDVRRSNLILFGDPGSNRWIAEILPNLPVRWTRQELQVGNNRFNAAEHGLALISPNPLSAAEERYVVFNSGHSYHDSELRFSYMVFPRLGDWAVKKISPVALDSAVGTVPETVVTSGFFDENWGLAESDK